MVLMKPDYARCYCHACGGSADIFEAANLLEGKPLSGKAFITENVNYLSGKFGYPPIEIEFTQKDEERLLAERIHAAAASLFTNMLNIEQAMKRGWMLEPALRRLRVGTIAKPSDFVQELMKLTQTTKDELEKSGLDIRMFAPHMLTFALEDSNGNCIGFASRNMDYEKLKGQANVQKFLNPSSSAPLYNKGRFVYGLGEAKRSRRIVLVEGYADVISARLSKIEGVAAFGGAMSFNHDKVEELRKVGAKYIILAGDYDFGKIDARTGKPVRAGQDGTLKALEVMRQYPDIKTRVLDYMQIEEEIRAKRPDLTAIDLDTVINVLGPSVAERLISTPISPIEFMARDLKNRGVVEPRDTAEVLVDIVAQEPNPLDIPFQVDIIVDLTGISKDIIAEAVKVRRQAYDLKHREKTNEIIAETNKRLYRAKEIGEIIDIAKDGLNKIEQSDPRRTVLTIEQEIKWVEEAEAKSDGLVGQSYYKTDLHFFDIDMGGGYVGEKKPEPAGIPDCPAYILFPGYPQSGKSMAVQALVHGAIKHNDKLDFIVMAPDDGREGWLKRLWCLQSGLMLHECINAKRYLQDPGDARIQSLKRGQQVIKKWIADRRITLRDSSAGVGMSALERMVEEHRRSTDRKFVVVLDGIHKLSGVSDQAILEDYSTRIKQMTQKYNTTVIVTAELRKRVNEMGTSRYDPPTAEDIKGTKQIEHDADVIYLMDNPIRRIREPRDLGSDNNTKQKSFWDFQNTCWMGDINKPTINRGTGKDEFKNERPKPVLWIHREKNKIIDLTGDQQKYYSVFYSPNIQFVDAKPYLPTTYADVADSING